jgi:hypothetical protein
MATATADAQKTDLLERTERVEENLQAAKPSAVSRATEDEWINALRQAVRGIHDAVLDVCNVLPEGTADREGKLLLIYMTELWRLVDDDAHTAARDGRIEHKRLQMLDVIKRLERRLRHERLDIPEHGATYLFQTLDSLTASELAELLGVTTKTIGTWRQHSPIKQKQHVDRVTHTAQIVYNLGRSMTPRGILLWFHSPQDKLRGATPLDQLTRGLAENNEQMVTAVKSLARGGRAQLAN